MSGPGARDATAFLPLLEARRLRTNLGFTSRALQLHSACHVDVRPSETHAIDWTCSLIFQRAAVHSAAVTDSNSFRLQRRPWNPWTFMCVLAYWTTKASLIPRALPLPLPLSQGISSRHLATLAPFSTTHFPSPTHFTATPPGHFSILRLHLLHCADEILKLVTLTVLFFDTFSLSLSLSCPAALASSVSL